MFYFDNALVSQVDSVARYNLGQEVIDPATGRHFRYIKQIGATTSAVGEVAAAAATWGTVTRTAATSIINAVSTVAVPAGVFQSVLATDKFGFIQTKGDGRVTLAVTDGNVAAGDPLVIDGGATAVGAVDTMADGEEEGVFGFALAADSGTTQPASTYILNCV
jgi:hypothetical protein